MTRRRSPLVRPAFLGSAAIAAGLVSGMMVATACDPGGDAESSEAAFCRRYDECNYIPPGDSLQDCTDSIRLCTRDLVTSARTDWQDRVDECLALANCENFYECTLEIDECTLDDHAGPPDGPSAPSCGDPICDQDWCTETEACSVEWDGDGECDCGCDFFDRDCQ